MELDYIKLAEMADVYYANQTKLRVGSVGYSGVNANKQQLVTHVQTSTSVTGKASHTVDQSKPAVIKLC